mmetsp:Transcript_5850/g.17548  ORF Transcript_5850/g.17548 Transcript_5850/m.17548 type:complete len:914 (-) Transcript_5850:1945-4686(-)|eukprot:CAMPEP_0198725968 /NCGR_PEP_ID=MMETSP1475-20131203/3149_1 /TAXON_ID= ORGANISM="Unidentified sp., Strain CCMP1999" /NCGR_SAMPLE_ID=MMETSP1475 /ASSEMBLY_ACC=CAM_ASM_001111 /LENGTH=913 /DNA_ID=CAMNT_0044487829 /DNA_START=211 /DNA_END=2952 /DNA_ORIENTATION=-
MRGGTSRLYEKIVDDISTEDGLVVMAHGLGVPFAISHFVSRALESNAQGSLVLGLMMSATIVSEMWKDVTDSSSASKLSIPRLITSEYSVAERKEVYASGGFLAATARILSHDFLRGIVPADKVLGIVVNDAHRVSETSPEAFVLRLYRRSNREGFIKAFTEDAEAMTRGFHNAEKVMRSLFVKRLFLWPRFHEVVQDVLDERPADVVELAQPMTTTMLAIQQSILDVMSMCLQDLRKASKNVDLTDIHVEDALHRSFHDIVKRQLEPVWHMTGSRTRQLVEDLRTLRKLLLELHRMDCIRFNELVESLRHAEGANSTWLMSRNADVIFSLVKGRVYRTTMRSRANSDTAQDGRKRRRGSDDDSERQTELDAVVVTPVLEENPKWKVLLDVLGEIRRDANGLKAQKPRAVIFVRDESAAVQLRDCLSKGTSKMLNDNFEIYLYSKSTRMYRAALHTSMSNAQNKDVDLSGSLQTTLTQYYGDSNAADSDQRRFLIEPAVMTTTAEGAPGSTPVIAEVKPQEPGNTGDDVLAEEGQYRSCSSQNDDGVEIILAVATHVPGSIKRFLDDVQPSFIVIYDPFLECIRQIELYKADRPGFALRVYFMVYDKSVEERRYTYVVQKEQEAFEVLIREKTSMIVHADQEGRQEDGALEDEVYASALGVGRALGTDRDSRLRKAAGAKNAENKIIVDMRELRSSLCGILYSVGMELLPMTLPIGDYILSPTTCVERKSIPDLISSFNSGRLFNQVEKMIRYYKTPCLLLEFDQNRPFCLASSADLEKQVTVSSIVAKMVILTQQFPQLRLLWSRSPHETARLFKDLKHGNQDPDEAAAAQYGLDEDDAEADGDLNIGPLYFLRSLPGVTTKSIRRVLNRVASIRELVQCSEAELIELLGPAGGRALSEFIHASPPSFEENE